MHAEEVPTDAMNKAMGSYFGASPLQRSMTWGSGYEDDDLDGTGEATSFESKKGRNVVRAVDQGRRSDVSIKSTGTDTDLNNNNNYRNEDGDDYDGDQSSGLWSWFGF